MIYLSQLLGNPVLDADGEKVGTVSDLGIATGEVFPRITSLAFMGPGRTPIMVSWRKFVDTYDEREVHLKVVSTDLRFSFLQPDEVLLALQQLAGVVLPASVWESHVLPARISGYQPSHLDQLLAEGERDAQIIMSESDAEVAAIVAEGREEAAAINAETEREVAEIYASAHSQDPELYEFLQKLAALENSVDEDTVMIITMDTPPFDVLYGDD